MRGPRGPRRGRARPPPSDGTVTGRACATGAMGALRSREMQVAPSPWRVCPLPRTLLPAAGCAFSSASGFVWCPPCPPPRRAVLRTAPRMKLPEKRVEVLGYEARRAPWPLAAPCGPTGMQGDALAAMRGPRRGLRRSDHPVAVSPPLPATLTDMTCSPCCSLHVARGAVARALPSARRPR